MSSGNDSAIREKQVQKALGHLEETISALDKAIDMNYESLQPILNSEAPEKEPVPKSEPYNTPMAIRISESEDRISQCIARLRIIHNRIEI